MKIISLSVWTNRFEKAKKLKPYDDGQRMRELLAEFSDFFVAHYLKMTHGEEIAFRRLGGDIQREVS
jgi:hypothetical protein